MLTPPAALELPRFDIDPDIAQAWTLPAEFYVDPALYPLVLDRVFARSWQYALDAERVRVPGQVQPFTLLEGALDQPLLFARDADDRLRALSNVCTHRGHLVAEAGGVERFLRCRYHGRRFGLDGRCLSMPEFEAVAGFPAASDHLPELPHDQLGPLLFVALAPAHPFAEVFAEIDSRLAWYPWDRLAFEPARSRDYLVKANWALYCDNYLEGFHIPFVHAGLATALDYDAYRTELFRRSNLQVGIAADGEEAFDLPPSSPDFGQRIGGYYFWAFPNLMLNFYPWGLSLNLVQPLAVDRTKVSYRTYVFDRAKLDRGAGSGLDRVEREDEAVVEAVHRGLVSRLYRRGRYSPTREQGVHHFHRLFAEALA